MPIYHSLADGTKFAVLKKWRAYFSGFNLANSQSRNVLLMDAALLINN